MTKGRHNTKGLGSFLLACVLGILILPVAAAQQPATGAASPDIPREVVLQQQAVPYELESAYWSLDKPKAPYWREPDLGTQGVFRAVLRFGNKDTNNSIALIWDRRQSKLYLDLNRNLDLTDDPAGVFTSTNKDLQQTFTGVTVPLKTAWGVHPEILDLRLSVEGTQHNVQAQVSSRYVWQAKVGRPGEEWQVAVLDELLNWQGPTVAKFLLLRPWSARTNPVSPRDLGTGLVPFPDQLFWLGQAFRVERRIDTQGQVPVCKLEFTPQEPVLTEVKLSGDSLYYAVLRATDGYTVVLREPQGAVKVPKGVYGLSALWLRKGAAEAYRLGYEPLLVHATGPTNVVLGGPLTNTVTLTRQGQKLNIGYQLVGADGSPYRLARQDYTKPPEFTVYRGGAKVHSGKFEFG